MVTSWQWLHVVVSLLAVLTFLLSLSELCAEYHKSNRDKPWDKQDGQGD
jgi:hypothetical protein